MQDVLPALSIPFLRTYTVFNVQQIEGLPARYYPPPLTPEVSLDRLAHAEKFFAATGAKIIHGGNRACYVPCTDRIHMPLIDTFRDTESYYATLAHECTHWILLPSRLNRELSVRFGEERYAREELQSSVRRFCVSTSN